MYVPPQLYLLIVCLMSFLFHFVYSNARHGRTLAAISIRMRFSASPMSDITNRVSPSTCRHRPISFSKSNAKRTMPTPNKRPSKEDGQEPIIIIIITDIIIDILSSAMNRKLFLKDYAFTEAFTMHSST